jgi:hypothetical protein
MSFTEEQQANAQEASEKINVILSEHNCMLAAPIDTEHGKMLVFNVQLMPRPEEQPIEAPKKKKSKKKKTNDE